MAAIKKKQIGRLTRDRLQEIRQKADSFSNFKKNYLENHTREQEILNQTEEALQNYWEFLTSGQAIGQPNSELKKHESAITKAVAPFCVLEFHRSLYEKAKTLLRAVKNPSPDPQLWFDLYEIFTDIKVKVTSYTSDQFVKEFYHGKPLETAHSGYSKPVVLKDQSPKAATENFKKNLDYLHKQLRLCVVSYYMQCVYFSPEDKRRLLEKKIAQFLGLLQKLICTHQITLSTDKIISSVLAYEDKNVLKVRGDVSQNIAAFNKAIEDYTAFYEVIERYPELHDNREILSVPTPTLDPKLPKNKRSIREEIIQKLHTFQTALLTGHKKVDTKKLSQLKKDLKTLLGIKIQGHDHLYEITPLKSTLRPSVKTRASWEVRDLKYKGDVLWNGEDINAFLEKHGINMGDSIQIRVPEKKEKFFKIIKTKDKPQVCAYGFMDIVSNGKSIGVLEITANLTFPGLTDNSLAVWITRSAIKAAADDIDKFVPNLLLTMAENLKREYLKPCHNKERQNFFGYVELCFVGFEKKKKPETHTYGERIGGEQLFYACLPIETRFNNKKPTLGINLCRIAHLGNQRGIIEAKIEIGKPGQALLADLSFRTLELDKKQSRTITFQRTKKEITVQKALRDVVNINVNFKGNLHSIDNTTPKGDEQKQKILSIFFNIDDDKSLEQATLTKSDNVKILEGLVRKLVENDQPGKISAAQNIIEFFCLILKDLKSTFKGSASIDGSLWDSQFSHTTEVDLGTDIRSSSINTRLAIQSGDYIGVGEGNQSIIFNLSNLKVDAGTNKASRYFPRSAASLSTNLEANLNHSILQDKFATLKCDILGEISFPKKKSFVNSERKEIILKPGGLFFELVHKVIHKPETREELNHLFENVRKEADDDNFITKGISKASACYRLCEKIVNVLKETEATFLGDIILTFILPDNRHTRQFTLKTTVNTGHSVQNLGYFRISLKHSKEKTQFERTNLLQCQLPETPLGALFVRFDDIDINASHSANTKFRLSIKTIVSSLNYQKAIKASCVIKGEMKHTNGEHAVEMLIKAFEANTTELQKLYNVTETTIKKPKSLEQYVTKTSVFYTLGNKILDIIQSSKVIMKGSIAFHITDLQDQKHKIDLITLFNTEGASKSLGAFAIKLDYYNVGNNKESIAHDIYYPLSLSDILGPKTLYLRMNNIPKTLYLRMNNIKVHASSGNKPKFETQLRIGAFETISQQAPVGGIEIVIKGQIEHKNHQVDTKFVLLQAFYKYQASLHNKFNAIFSDKAKGTYLGKIYDPMALKDFLTYLRSVVPSGIQFNLSSDIRAKFHNQQFKFHLDNQRMELDYDDPDHNLRIPIESAGNITLGDLNLYFLGKETTQNATPGILHFNMILYLRDQPKQKPYGALRITSMQQFSYPTTAIEGLNAIAAEINNRSQILQTLTQRFIDQGLWEQVNSTLDYKTFMRLLLQFIKACAQRAGCRLKGEFRLSYAGKTPGAYTINPYLGEAVDWARSNVFGMPNPTLNFNFDTGKPALIKRLNPVSEQARRLVMWVVVLKTIAKLGRTNLARNTNAQKQRISFQAITTAKKIFEELVNQPPWRGLLSSNLTHFTFYPSLNDFFRDEAKRLQQELADSHNDYHDGTPCKDGPRVCYWWVKMVETVIGILSQTAWSNYINLQHVTIDLPSLYPTPEAKQNHHLELWRTYYTRHNHYTRHNPPRLYYYLTAPLLEFKRTANNFFKVYKPTVIETPHLKILRQIRGEITDSSSDIYKKYISPNADRFLHYLCLVQSVFFDQQTNVTINAIKKTKDRLSHYEPSAFPFIPFFPGKQAVIPSRSDPKYLEGLDRYLQTIWKKLGQKLLDQEPTENMKALTTFTAFLESSPTDFFFLSEEHKKATIQQLSHISIRAQLTQQHIQKLSQYILDPVVLYQGYIFESFQHRPKEPKNLERQGEITLGIPDNHDLFMKPVDPRSNVPNDVWISPLSPKMPNIPDVIEELLKPNESE